MLNTILPLEPFLVEKIWGGERIAAHLSLPAHSRFGESWVVSRLEEGSSESKLGLLSNLVEEDQLPYLVKFLDTIDHLSVQVHPDDSYARRFEQSAGKTECWYILEAADGAGIYLGLAPGVTRSQLEQVISENGNVEKLLNFIPVKKGDFFFVPAGTIHAIGADIFLIEIQQSSGVTYRVWDWNRKDDKGIGRTLHLKQALEVINFDQNREKIIALNFNDRKKEVSALVEFKDFNVLLYQLIPSGTLMSGSKRMGSVIVLKGRLELTDGDTIFDLEIYQSVLIPISTTIGFRCYEDCSFIFVS